MKKWTDSLWIYTPLYLILGLFNILFAWLGVIEFLIPFISAFTPANKKFCNLYCPRSRFFEILGNKFHLSRHKAPPAFLSAPWFRYGFLAFFMTMFGLMIFNTYQVFAGTRSLNEVITILWTFKFGWFAQSFGPDWVVQFGYGMYSMMLTSSILGILMMILYRPRSWCAYCPMGTMTQSICKLKARN